jgi:outer membrane protein assembly factor BamD
MQFPDSKLVPEAKQRLLEVQEVLAEREFRVGRFYYLRESYPAAIARLRSVVDRYPLYSQADEALYLLGQAYEGEIAMVRSRKGNEVAKARMIQEFTNGAAESYSRIVTRYPLMNRMDDAKARLEALHQPVPKPTKTAVAQNKAEEDSRRETGMFGKVMRNFQKHPDVAQATKVGDPTLVDPQMVSATEVVQKATRAMMGTSTPADNNAVSVETVGKGAPPANQAAPRSDTENPGTPVENSAAPPPAPDPNELKPNVAPDPNELKPNVADENGQALPPPQQVNELAPGANPATPEAAKTDDGKTTDSASSANEPADDAAVSSSKRKKKKGLRKIVPF